MRVAGCRKLMRVLLISDMYLQPDKTISANFVHRQVQEVRRLGVDVRVLSPIPSVGRCGLPRLGGAVSRSELEIDGVPVVKAGYPKRLPYRFAARTGCHLLAGMLQREASKIRSTFTFDLIHATRLFPVVSASVSAAAALGVPLLGVGRGSDVHTHPLRSSGIAALTRQAIEESDWVAAVSRDLADQIVGLGNPLRPVRVIYNGVDAMQFAPRPELKRSLRQRFGLPAKGVGLCYLGRLVKSKGLKELVEAFSHLAEGDPETWLVIIGDGPFRKRLQVYSRSLGIASRVFTLGARSHKEVPALLNTADVFVLPSYNEGLPNAVLEAMASGLPVVSTNSGGTREVVVEGKTGFLVEPGEVGDLVERIGALHGDEAMRRRFGEAARAVAVSRFSWETSAATLVDLYGEILRSA